MPTVSLIQPIHLQYSQYTEVSKYTDDTVWSCSTGDLDIIVHIYFSDTDVLVLALRKVLELSAENDVMIVL